MIGYKAKKRQHHNGALFREGTVQQGFHAEGKSDCRDRCQIKALIEGLASYKVCRYQSISAKRRKHIGSGFARLIQNLQRPNREHVLCS